MNNFLEAKILNCNFDVPNEHFCVNLNLNNSKTTIQDLLSDRSTLNS